MFPIVFYRLTPTCNLRFIKDGQIYEFDEPVLFASLGNNHWEESYLIGNDLINVQIKEFIPNPYRFWMQTQVVNQL